MGFKINDFTPLIKSQNKQRSNIFLRLACDSVVDNARPNTPKSSGVNKNGSKAASGNLRNDVLKQVDGLHGRVEWRKVYASYQERGKRADGSRVVRKYTTPGTGPHFAEKAVQKTVTESHGLLKASRLI